MLRVRESRPAQATTKHNVFILVALQFERWLAFKAKSTLHGFGRCSRIDVTSSRGRQVPVFSDVEGFRYEKESVQHQRLKHHSKI